mmetsp:Transcript_19084/g.49257  ORF Transcript_19084/g.49257 Transcript_19084/m.49257 type:complete len:242 (-) Transcript_19084:235-960(-)
MAAPCTACVVNVKNIPYNIQYDYALLPSSIAPSRPVRALLAARWSYPLRLSSSTPGSTAYGAGLLAGARSGKQPEQCAAVPMAATMRMTDTIRSAIDSALPSRFRPRARTSSPAAIASSMKPFRLGPPGLPSTLTGCAWLSAPSCCSNAASAGGTSSCAGKRAERALRNAPSESAAACAIRSAAASTEVELGIVLKVSRFISACKPSYLYFERSYVTCSPVALSVTVSSGLWWKIHSILTD